MSILFSGDFHANSLGELGIITKDALTEKYSKENYDSIKYHIILGDCGFLWPGCIKNDIFNFRTLADRGFPILGVIGNHEPMLGMDNLPEVDIGLGETVIKIWEDPFVAYLKRGKKYTIEGIKFLVLGGALSIDQNRRTPNLSWWKKEYWSMEEKINLFKLLKTHNTFDYVLSHTGPQHINYRLFGNNIRFHKYIEKFSDEVALLNDEIHDIIKFHEWWCGHWHKDLYHYDRHTFLGYQYLYNSTKIMNKKGNKITVYNENNMGTREYV